MREGTVPICPAEVPTRQVLALLTAAADRVVPAYAVAEELWPQGVPDHAQDALEHHIGRLRAVVNAALQAAGSERTAEDVLASVPGGYRLDTSGGSSDLRGFERLTGAGYRAMEAGDLHLASQRLREALALWTGAPLSGVPHGPQLSAHAARLTCSWQRAVDRWIDAELRLGRWRELCADLAQALTRYCPATLLYAQLKADLDRMGQDRDVIRDYLRRRREMRTVSARSAPGRVPVQQGPERQAHCTVLELGTLPRIPLGDLQSA
ncbi:BTAD domain-containing putative transcriptional regulator [Streptomyces sp. SA15]|uniref:AfsR/SARP family transcriptional regulator n=1 Tax=Streptomyces sp. SA15 TaxID=934019 RepID=UPI00211CD986|nr:BTAD domain-containing putative transcriptional regulator [Streptomyces sp. SA15]